MKKALLLSVFLAPFLAGILVAVTVFVLYKMPYQGAPTVFTVRPGEAFSQVNARLYKQGLINNTRLFHYMAKHKNWMSKMKAGSFDIPSGATMEEVLDTLVNGQPNLQSLTIPEGRNMYEIAQIIENQKLGTKEDFLKLVKSKDFLESQNIHASTAEGYLYPETYKFAPYTSLKEIVISMLRQFKQKAEPLLSQHSFLKPYEVLTLASVVEKETGASFERPLIASVFTNRLKKKMRLESDPTTIYGIYEHYKGNITKNDLLTITPYNTYKIPGLPIGPISNPSLEAVKAVIHPETSNYLFFVSKNDGTHVFSSNYQQHSQAVIEFQKNAAARRGKSWRQLKKD